MASNPLSNYYRTPVVHIRLPSEGKYWPEGSIIIPPNGELPVLPMSGKDDIALRNADGLMNGATTVDIIQSCFPNIKDAWKTPMIDLDAIMIAIRQASYGQTMTFNSKCSKCGEFHEYEIDLGIVRDTIKIPDYTTPLLINDLMITVRPGWYEIVNEGNLDRFAQQRAVKAITDSSLNEEEKIAKFKETIAEFTEKTVAKIAVYIESIITPDGTKVTDQAYITEFVNNADQKTFNAIKDFITNKNAQYKLDPISTKCDKCGFEETRAFQFDPSNFFG